MLEISIMRLLGLLLLTTCVATSDLEELMGTEPAWIRVWDPATGREPDLAKACGTSSLADASVSPLEHYLVASEHEAVSVTVELSAEAGPPERLLAALRCHRAWMRQQPRGTDECPVGLPGLLVEIQGDDAGITLQLHVRDHAFVPELHRRATLYLTPPSQVSVSANPS